MAEQKQLGEIGPEKAKQIWKQDWNLDGNPILLLVVDQIWIIMLKASDT